MSDDEKKAAEVAAAKAEAEAAEKKAKQYSEEDFKAVVAQRQELKARLAAIEDAQKRADENKKVEEGKVKEVLAQRDAELDATKKQLEETSTKAKAFEDQQSKIREQAINKLTDDKLKALAGKLSNVDDVLEFVNIHTESKVATFADKSKKDVQDADKNPMVRRSGESFNEYQTRVGQLKNGQ